jgi:hypothetical protein
MDGLYSQQKAKKGNCEGVCRISRGCLGMKK